MRHTKRFKRQHLVAALCLGLATVSGVAAAASNWNPAHILTAFENPYVGNTKYVGVASHRGVVGNGCPENSTCSIVATYNNNVEAIELDVKEDAEGGLWLFHDQNAGRILDHNPNFNIFQPASNPSGWNPDFRTMSSTELTNSFLRDRNFAKTGYRPVTLERALQTVRSSANHMIVILDLKSLSAVSEAATQAVQDGMQNQVVLKFSSSLFAGNPNAIKNYTKGVAWVPTVYAGDMDRIADSYNGLCGVIAAENATCRVNAWVSEVRAIGASWLEIGNKQPVSGDPTDNLLRDYEAARRAVGAFSPVAEYRLSSHDGYHFVRSNGTCCASLSDYLTRTKYFGNETADSRPNFREQVVAGATNVITDDPLTVIPAVIRNTSRYQ